MLRASDTAEVEWVAAVAASARVVDLVAFWDVPVSQPPYGSVQHLVTPRPPDSDVAVVVPRVRDAVPTPVPTHMEIQWSLRLRH
ncbi:protein of unknown function [Cupriavidus taiwanensis]|nr:protein of unknown function [Cupriavidus taiwanensis]